MKIIRTFFTALLLFGGLNEASAEESIGKVVAVEGTAKAAERSLSRGASIFISDVIHVADASKIQIKFTDGGLLNLASSTEYRVDSYQFNTGGENKYSAELLQGGFRAVSGSIAKENPDGVSVKTPVATIGIRGTLFEAHIQGGETFFGCESGSVKVSNSAGTRDLLPGQFVSSASRNSLGAVTTVRPPALAPHYFTTPKGGESLQKAEKTIQASEKSAAKKEPAEKAQPKKKEPLKEIHVPRTKGNPSC